MMVKSILAILVLQQTAALGSAQSVYQCQPTSDQSGQVYTPNIPDFYFDQGNVAGFSGGGGATLDEAREGFTYFFTLPAMSPERNCSGTVQAIQFCYHARLKNDEIGEPQDVFEFLVVDRQNSLFGINGRFNIQDTFSSSNCVTTKTTGMHTEHDCCTTFEPPTQLQISSSSFTFGVRVIIDKDVRSYAFRSSVEEFRVEQFQVNAAATAGSSVTLDSAVTDNALLLLRFILGD